MRMCDDYYGEFKKAFEGKNEEDAFQKARAELDELYNARFSMLKTAYDRAKADHEREVAAKVAEMERASREGDLRTKGREHLINAVAYYYEALTGEAMDETKVQELGRKIEEEESKSWDTMKSLYALIQDGAAVSLEDTLAGLLGVRASTSPTHQVKLKVDFKAPETVEEAIEQLKQMKEIWDESDKDED